jgi:hypothetical protein
VTAVYSATAHVIRDAHVTDVPELVRLGWATEQDWPAGRIMVGEIGGVVAAALAVDENRAVIAATPRAPHALVHVRMRAAGLRAAQRTPAVADRIRERVG